MEESPRLAISRDGLLAILALAVIAVLFLAPPSALLEKADHAAYAVCHRIPNRSFSIAGRPLPLCARCSGTYLGIVSAMIVFGLRGRLRAARLPGRPYQVIFVLFLLLWALDGLNSFVTLFPGIAGLYEPRNWLRLTTGTLQGIALTALSLPIFSITYWEEVDARPPVGSWRDLAWLLVGGSAVIALIMSEQELLLYPLALASGASVVAILGLVNSLVVIGATRRGAPARRWQDLAIPLLIGIALAAVELAVLAAGRGMLERWAGGLV